MDPNATLRDIHDFLTARQTGEEVDYLCECLYDWLQSGGFEPDWQAYPTGTEYYKCRVISIERGERVA